MARWLIPIVAAGAAAVSAAPSGLPVKLETRTETKSRVANVHLSLERAVEGAVTVAYGSCESKQLADTHSTVVESEIADGQRLVWLVPEDAETGGCLSAFDGEGSLVGRSEPQLLQHHWKRRLARRDDGAPESIYMHNSTLIDTLGAWFQGVKLLENKQPKPVYVEEAKAKEIAVIGTGMSGLMSWLVLSQAGMKNLTLLEGSKRLGGRVRTEYLSGGPFDYSYQEMGPMRFPYQFTDPATGEQGDITDQQVVYQLADELNKLNGNKSEFSVDWITWVEGQPNALIYNDGFKLPSGLPPTRAQIAEDPSLGPPQAVLPESAQQLQSELNEYLPDFNFTKEIAANLWKAHSDFLKDGLNGMGGDQWSEFAFVVNYLGGSLEDANLIGRFTQHNFWYLAYNMLYFAFGTWRTIDGGLNRLPNAFKPLLEGASDTTNVMFDTRIEGIKHDESTDQLELSWHDSWTSDNWHNATYDYAIVSAPFNSVRTWKLPSLKPTISSAIQGLPYAQGCKVALEFSERFWEQYDNPINGGCGTSTDRPGIGSICYPSYDMNGTGPATLLASYNFGDWCTTWQTRSDEEHVKYVLDEMVAIHGEHIRELYTGKYSRKLWGMDPLTQGWADPSIGMHQLFIPAYFETHKNMIFVGEHTGVTHGWIAPAVETGLRGAVQLLLELGLVDEAKEAVDKWAGRWIDI